MQKDKEGKTRKNEVCPHCGGKLKIIGRAGKFKIKKCPRGCKLDEV